MAMLSQFCGHCEKPAWHNERKKEGKHLGFRCTACGYPPLDGGPQTSKRAFAEAQCRRLSGKK